MRGASASAVLHAGPERGELGSLMQSFDRVRAETVRLSSELARDLGVALTDLRVITFVVDHDSVTPKQVAQHLGVTTGALTSILDRVESAGYVQRTAHPTDRRSLLIALTPDGHEAVTRIRAAFASAFSAAIPAEQMAIVGEVFDRLALELARR